MEGIIGNRNDYLTIRRLRLTLLFSTTELNLTSMLLQNWLYQLFQRWIWLYQLFQRWIHFLVHNIYHNKQDKMIGTNSLKELLCGNEIFLINKQANEWLCNSCYRLMKTRWLAGQHYWLMSINWIHVVALVDVDLLTSVSTLGLFISTVIVLAYVGHLINQLTSLTSLTN